MRLSVCHSLRVHWRNRKYPWFTVKISKFLNCSLSLFKCSAICMHCMCSLIVVSLSFLGTSMCTFLRCILWMPSSNQAILASEIINLLLRLSFDAQTLKSSQFQVVSPLTFWPGSLPLAPDPVIDSHSPCHLTVPAPENLYRKSAQWFYEIKTVIILWCFLVEIFREKRHCTTDYSSASRCFFGDGILKKPSVQVVASRYEPKSRMMILDIENRIAAMRFSMPTEAKTSDCLDVKI